MEEWDEKYQVSLTLTSTPYATLAKGIGIGTILDDDAPGGAPELSRILHKKQDCCCKVCESNGQSVDSKDGGFTQTLLSSLAELPTYFADATYNAAAAIFNFALHLPQALVAPETITVQMDVGTQTGNSAAFLNTFQAGETAAFALAGDYTALTTGVYPLKATVKAYRAGQLVGQRTLQDQVVLIDLSESSFGTRWWLPSLDRLFVAPSGIGLVEGDNNAWFFPNSGSGYRTPDGFSATFLPPPADTKSATTRETSASLTVWDA